MSNQDAFDATQRVYLDADGHPTTPPKPQPVPRPPRPTPAERAAQKRRQQRITLISLCAAAAVLLIVLVIVLINALTKPPVDDGKILPNVTAAGVNIGGMTPEDAKKALHAATDQTYSKLDMVININMSASKDAAQTPANTTLILSAEKTGAKLDVDAVVKAAYDLGRTGSRYEQQQAHKVSHTVSVVPHLNLDSTYIKSEVNALGAQYSTLLKESTYSFTGTRPNMVQTEYDTTIAYETLTIQMGTPYYALNTEDLYEKVLANYDTNLFELDYTCTVQLPKPLDCLAIFNEATCVAPVEPVWDEENKVLVSPEAYGYGFTLEELQNAVDKATYGEKITVELRFIAPQETSDFYLGKYFQDTLFSWSTKLSADAAWNTNLQLICDKLNNYTLNAGEDFSFNAIAGQITNFKTVEMYLGKSFQKVEGGGISQIATTLYYGALKTDMEILERHSHSYAVDFGIPGFDAAIYKDGMDFRFRNSMEDPIRIQAEIVDDKVVITFLGTDSRDYTVDLLFKVDETFAPGTVVNTMSPDNPGGYVNGQVLRPGIAGSLVSTYVVRYDKETGNALTQIIDGVRTDEIPIAQTYYAKQDTVIVEIYTPPVDPDPPVVDPDDPDNPDNPDDPENPVDPEIPGGTTTE